MKTFEFTLIIDGADLLTDAHLDALFEAGCDDATFGARDYVHYAAFDREAENLGDAVISAIHAIEQAVSDATVVRIEPDELVSQSVIAKRTGRTKESVRLLYTGQRGPGGFPAPVSWIDQKHKVWHWSEGAEWFEQALGEPIAAGHEAETIATLNGMLEARRHLRRVSDAERHAVAAFVHEDAELNSLLAV